MRPTDFLPFLTWIILKYNEIAILVASELREEYDIDDLRGEEYDIDDLRGEEYDIDDLRGEEYDIDDIRGEEYDNLIKVNRETKHWMRHEVSATHEELSWWLKDENVSGVGTTTIPLEIVNLAIDESGQSFPTTEWAFVMYHNDETQQENGGAQSCSLSSTPSTVTSQKKRKRQSKFFEVAQEMYTMRMEVGKMIEASLMSNDIQKENNELEKIKNEIEKEKNELEKIKNEIEKEKNELNKCSLIYPLELDALLIDLKDDIGSEIALKAFDYFMENPNSLPIFVHCSRPNKIRWLIWKFGQN